ncbi:helix-turn-helix transcriptional regulator [Streptomyces sp. 2P-4]|uniref:helix-turn-helix transcriptional regulator n=1 Tax=Streptomyces sp. 2P-4 TaxID=2931974 RepID=UPI002540B83D|nr:helix-turn-helix transcriptional regulator [Streptomyces sp. 2P-4]
MFRSSDPAETEAYLSRQYADVTVHASPDARTEVVRHTADRFSVEDVRIGCEMSFTADPLDAVCVVVLHTGTIAVRESGLPDEVFGPGEVFLHTAGHRPFTGAVSGARYTAALLHPDLLADTLQACDKTARRPVLFTDRRPATAGAGRQLAATVAFLRDSVLAPPPRPRPPIIDTTCGQLLAAAVLSAFPYTTPGARPAAAPGDATLQRAIAFIEANAHLDITLADIAASIPVSPRAVQYAFARHAGTTPLAYLRGVRLARVHEELASAMPGQSTVTETAARWGFAHPGRFAAAYREAYGTSPSRTLAARPSRTTLPGPATAVPAPTAIVPGGAEAEAEAGEAGGAGGAGGAGSAGRGPGRPPVTHVVRERCLVLTLWSPPDPDRRSRLVQHVRSLLDEHRPDCVVVELPPAAATASAVATVLTLHRHCTARQVPLAVAAGRSETRRLIRAVQPTVPVLAEVPEALEQAREAARG